MPWEPQTTTGYLKLGLGDGLTGGSAGMTDVSEQVTSCRLVPSRDVVEVPATLGAPRGARAGGAKYELEVGFMSANNGTGVWSILESAFTGTGEVSFEFAMKDGTVSATNPRYFGTIIVIGAGLGGEAEGLSSDSQTFPLKSSWTKATT